jgi:anti-sigma factor RsiW
MTDCPRGDIRDLLPELVHGHLGGAERAEVERHVASCAKCSAELALLRSARLALSKEPRVDVARIAAAVAAAHGARGVRESNDAPAQQRTPRRRTLAWEWRAAAGIAAVAVGVMSYAVGRGHTAAPSRIVPEQSGESSPVGPNAQQATRPATQAATRPAAQTAEVPHGLMFAGGVSDLPDSAVRALLQSVDNLQAVPDADPQPVLDPVGEGAL